MSYERIKIIREHYGKTQKEVGEMLGVKRQTYCGWENGYDSMPLIKLNDFCNYFNVSLDFVCGLTDTKNYNNIVNTTIDKHTIGNNLKDIRLKHNDTQKNVALAIKIDQSNYSKYELGKILIHTYNIIAFAKYYKTSIDFICGKITNIEKK